MNRVFNFSAGPSMLPVPVLERAAAELVCYGESGMSVMEMSHRSPDYEAIIKKTEADLRALMNIPDNYKVLFLQGGASTQFASVPINLIGRTGKADYVVSGQFSGKAYKEAQKMGYDVKCVATTKDDNFDHIPEVTKDMIRPDASYVHICFNNTIYLAKLVYEWILSIGGLEVMKEMNVKKAKLLYDYLDSQDYYIAPVKADSRSMMNVTFVTGDADLDKKFAGEAGKAGLKNLKGHRSVGGMRASIYNAMPYECVEALVAFMKEFAKNNPKK